MKNLLISSVISALIGLAIPYCIKYFLFLIKRASYDNLCGQWYSYSLLTENNHAHVLSGTVKISKSVLSLYKTLIHENGLTYKGNVYIENNHLLLIHNTSIETRTETACVRVDYSSYINRSTLHGYWLSFDSDNHISCGAILFSKTKLSTDEVLREMKSASINYKNLLLRLV